jgi:hypothetical protein
MQAHHLLCHLLCHWPYSLLSLRSYSAGSHVLHRLSGAWIRKLYSKDVVWTNSSGEQDGEHLSRVIALPVSSTGLHGWISLQAMRSIHKIRSFKIPFVLLSGARTSTIFQRLPYLPSPDAVATENGGRLFHADGLWQTCCPLREDLTWRALHDAMCGVASPPPLGLHVAVGSACPASLSSSQPR